MGEVVSILANQPHVTGKAYCLECKSEWVAVAEQGTVYLECPECGLEKGVFKCACLPADGCIFQCDCGCCTFVIRDNGQAMCGLCGLSHEI
jgi:hypothetical protein